MIEETLFLVAFSIQIVLLSVVHPAKLGRYILSALEKYPYAEYARMYPYPPALLKKLIILYRIINFAIVLAGVYLLQWFYKTMQSPDWSDGIIEAWITVYFLAQMVPLLIFSGFTHRYNKQLRNTANLERVTASLKRRSLYNYVSPSVLNMTLALYPVYLLFLVYVNSRGFPGFAGITVNAIGITLLYVWTLGFSYLKVFGKKANPYQGEDERHFENEKAVKISVYTCLFVSIFLMMNMVLAMTDNQSLEPLAMSLFFVLCSAFYIMGIAPESKQFDMEGYRSNSN